MVFLWSSPLCLLGETLLRPTSRCSFENLASMDAEESITRKTPSMESSCSQAVTQTTPSTLMGARQCGPSDDCCPRRTYVETENFKRQDVVLQRTHLWKFTDDLKTGKITS